MMASKEKANMTDHAIDWDPVNAYVQTGGQRGHRILRTPVGPEALRVAAEIRLIDRFQEHPKSLLDNPVAKSGNA